MQSVQSFPLAAKLEIESLRAQLEAVKKERDELAAAAKKFCDDWKFCRGSEWPVRALQELNAALAKLGADKTGEVG